MNAPAKAFWDEDERYYQLYLRPLIPRAAEELKDELMSGKKIQRYDLESILDETCQGEHYHDFLARVATAIQQNDLYWLRRYVEDSVRDFLGQEQQIVEDRARYLADCEEEMSKQRTNDADS